MKVPIDLGEMFDKQLLTLARKAIREFNDRNLEQFRVVRK
jgi:hypothetical protein